MTELNLPEPGCWVYAVKPSAGELIQLHESMDIPIRFLRAAIDEEESAHIDHESGCTLLMVDMPVVESEGGAFVYSTIPIGIILTADCAVTLATRECAVLNDFFERRVRGFVSAQRTRFILQILGMITSKFIVYLKQIDKTASMLEQRLIDSMSAAELVQMLKLEKSLVYFTASLRGNAAVLERILRQHHIEKLPEDLELLEDVIIENSQAIEMCAIYRDVLSGARNAFSALTANSTRRVTRMLTLAFVAVAPLMLAGLLWGMRVQAPLTEHRFIFAFIIIIATGSGVGISAYLYRKIK
jgi:magnesium transporter